MLAGVPVVLGKLLGFSATPRAHVRIALFGDSRFVHWLNEKALMGRLEQLACVCMVLVSVLAGYVLIENRFDRHPPNRPPSVESLVGTRIGLQGLRWEEAPLNVVIAMNTHCQYRLQALNSRC